MRRFALLILIALAASPAAAQFPGTPLVITMRVDGSVLRPGHSYYVAFSTDPSLLAGPRPDSTGWTHYLLLRDGRFYFGTVPQNRIGPFGFEQARSPVPYVFGQILDGGRGVQFTVNSGDLQAPSGPPVTIVKVNFVTLGADARVQSDALGPGNSDPVGYVSFDVRRDVFVPVTDPRGDETPRNPDLDVVGGEIRIGLP